MSSININHVTKIFNSNNKDYTALDDAHLQIKEGEFVCLLGPSGCGKSTLLNMMAGFEKPTKGEILIDGEKVDKPQIDRLTIFQDYGLLPWRSVEKNIQLGLETLKIPKDERKKISDKYISLVGLEKFKNHHPSELSGGMKQRVAIARALANNTDILICDEPTSALDAETTSSVLQLLKEVNKKFGVTIIIITHELDVVKSICNYTAVMSKGEVVEIGEVYEVFTNPKNEFTKQLIAHTQNFEIPKEIKKIIEGPIVKLIYLGEKAAEAVLSQTADDFNIKYNILHGKIEYIASKPLGILYVNIKGSKANIDKAIKKLKEKTYSTEVVFNA